MKFRIKIEELNNGSKTYIPQVKKYFTWCNIVNNRIYAYSSICIHHKTEEEVVEAIEKYKKKLEQERLKKLKSITYKSI